jgi:HD-like signal output (HDOD) protein
MADAIMSYIGSWWARWFGRAADLHVPVAEPVAEPIPESELVAELAPIHEIGVSELESADERSFRETVGMEQGETLQKRASTADPRVRAATLAALADLNQIPALQSLVEGVMRIMCRDGVGLDEIVEALEKDSALCVRILSMANSAAIAPELRIVDLQTAVQMLGIIRVRRVAQAVFTLRGAQSMAEGLDWRHLWIHALATAAIAEELDRRLRPGGSPQIYMAGLLHDVGKIVLSTVAGEAYREVIVASWNGEGRLEDLEQGRLGVGHREAGVIFAKGNHLSEIVIETIAHHDDPTKAESHGFEVALVSVANFMSKARGLGFSGARLDAFDGELEDLPAWKIFAADCGHEFDVGRLELDMADFFASIREDLCGLREVVH